ncbi:hypothetical protein QEN19_000486 [Hanseniaspora menglaensis]
MFKNNDISDNFNIIGSNALTPIIETNNSNPYSKTLWHRKEQNKDIVTLLKIDGKENIEGRLIKRRNQSTLTLPLNNQNNVSKLSLQTKKNSSAKSSSFLNESFEEFFLQSPTVLIKSSKVSSSHSSFKENQISKPINLLFNTSKHLKIKTIKKLVNEPIESTKAEFINILETFFAYEMSFVKKISLIINVFQKQYIKASMLKTMPLNNFNKAKIILFGNIQTMMILNESFLQNFKLHLSEYFNVNINDDQFWTIIKKNIINSNLKEFQVIQILNQEFIKWKYTYKTYADTYSKQLEYLQFLETNISWEQIFKKWMNECENDINIKTSGVEFFKDLLRKPNERIQNWSKVVNQLLPISESSLSLNSYDMCLRLKINLDEYCDNIFDQNQPSCLTVQKSENDSRDMHLNYDHMKTNNSISVTSSIYSEFNEIKTKKDYDLISLNYIGFKNFNKQMKINTDIPLNNQITQFNKIKKTLNSLEYKFDSSYMLDYIFALSSNTKKWQQIFNLENNIKDTPSNIYELYQQKIQYQLIHITELKNSGIKGIKKNIKTCLTYCDIFGKFIQEQFKLQQELLSISSADVKFIAVLNRKNYLTESLRIELNNFIPLCFAFTKLLILKFNEMFLQFFKIMAGNETNLDDFLLNYENAEFEFGDNFDIVQQYKFSKENNYSVIKNYRSSLNANTDIFSNNIRNEYECTKIFKYLFG